jgi:hypothetical protein
MYGRGGGQVRRASRGSPQFSTGDGYAAHRNRGIVNPQGMNAPVTTFSADPDELLRRRLPPSPFTAAEAEQRGVARRALYRLLGCGAIVRPLRGVYVHAADDLDLELRMRCVAKVCPPHCVATDRTAAWMWGVDVYPWRDRALPLPLDVFSLRGKTRTRREDVRGGQRDLGARDLIRATDGVQVTTPLRTALDLACGLNRYEALAAVDALMRAHGLTNEQLFTEIVRFRGRRGVVQAREIVALTTGLAESSGESWTRLAIHDDGLASPTPQVWVGEAGQLLYRLDLAYEHLRVAVEYDGVEHHSDEVDVEHDDRRRRWLEERGWIVIVVRKEDLSGARREAWLQALDTALRARSAEVNRRRLSLRPRSTVSGVPE